MSRPKNLKEALKGKLDKRQAALLGRSYDIVGDIAVIELSPKLAKKEKLIGEGLLKTNPSIKAVCRKVGERYGKYRKQKLKIIAGEHRKETICKENNVRLKLHIEKCYFSPRLASERKRIAECVKDGEDVLVMFSGVGPYVFVISKNTHAKHVVGIEANPYAHAYAMENKALNKAGNVELYCGDAREAVPRLKKRFDRIIMPLPKGAEHFLDVAFKACRKRAIIHFYDFEHEDEIEKAKEKVLAACHKYNKKCIISKVVRCGQHSPRKYRLCIDFIAN